MSNFRPLPHPPGAFSRVLVSLSIWHRPRSHAIELAVLLKVSGVSAIEFKMGGTEHSIKKSHPIKTRTSGTAGQRHQAVRTYTSAHGCLFQQDVLIYSSVFLKVSIKDGPRHALLMGWLAYTIRPRELHYKGEKGSLFVARRLRPITSQIKALLGFRSVKLARKTMAWANVVYPIHHRASLSPQ